MIKKISLAFLLAIIIIVLISSGILYQQKMHERNEQVTLLTNVNMLSLSSNYSQTIQAG